MTAKRGQNDAPSDGKGLLAVDLGGTRLRVAIFSGRGEMAYKSVVPTPADDPATLRRAAHEALEQTDVTVRDAVIGVPGLVNYDRGTVLRLPNLPGWESHLLAERLSHELGLFVTLANDADLAALGEHRFGAGQGVRDMLYVTSSTGVGAGVIIDGRLLHGVWSLAEAGHMIIDRCTDGTVESLGSGTALVRLAGAEGVTVAAQARAGDARALELFQEVADAFAIGVFNLAHCFMPERIVIGGGVAEAGDLLLDPVRRRLNQCAGTCSASGADVARARLHDDVGLFAALALWTDQLREAAP